MGMKKRLVIVALVAALPSASCTPFRAELQYPNGYTGYLLDRHTFDVSRSKDLQLLRATAVLAMAARMGTETVRDGRDADAFADYLAAASDEVNYAAAEIYPVGSTTPCGTMQDSKDVTCAGYYQNFESDLPLLEDRIVRVMLAALPQQQSGQFLADIKKGNVMAAAFTALRTAYQAAVGLDRSAGVYRTTLELVASNVACQNGQYDPSRATTWDALDCLGLSHEKFSKPPYALAEQSADPTVRERPVAALMRIIRASCVALPTTNDPGLKDQLQHRRTTCDRVAFNPQPRPSEPPSLSQ